jgi:midasin
MVFEWHDGILVEAMENGGLLLIDEISLANDSVLERINSVFESERMLILSEKSSTEAIKIVGQEGFAIVATMNPSGDFGKKELSPALRNRMTEIWVESYFLQPELMSLYTSSEVQVIKEISQEVDLYIIILKMSEDKLKLSKKEIKQVSLTLFNMIGFINFTLASKYSVLQRKALSVRDVINCIDFIQVSLPLFKDVSMCIFHSI